MNKLMEKAEALLELGGTKKDIAFLCVGGAALVLCLMDVQPFPFNIAWIAIILCGLPIVMEAIIGLVTAFDIKADVLVSIALVASVLIGEDFAAGEVAFIMQLGALLEDLVGIAMGGVGSDIAVDAADIVLVDDEVKELPHLLALSKRMMTTIKLNLTFSMTLNFVAIILAITGILNPVIGALVHNAGSVLVIINSAFLLNWRKKS